MKEQIEEMAVDLCLIDTCKQLPQEECNKTTCAHCEAEALYNAGYRKQSEVATKIFADLEKILCLCDTDGCLKVTALYSDYAELKKKHTEG